MKKVIIVLLACFSFLFSNQSNSFSIRKIQIVTPNVWYAALNYNGGPAILKTTNSGTNWTLYTNIFGGMMPPDLINDFCFGDVNTGYACGGNQTVYWIGKTTNGGITWDTINYANENGKNAIWFLNGNTGVVCGVQHYGNPYENGVFETTNGGLNWISKNISFERSVSFVVNSDNNHYFTNIVFYPNLYKHTFGIPGCVGSLALNASEYATVSSLNFMNADTGMFTCIMKTDDNICFGATTDAGNSWININDLNYSFSEIKSSGNAFYCLARESGIYKLAKTTNLGVSWSFQNYDVSGYVQPNLLAVKDNLFFIANWSGNDTNAMIRSTNSGVNWSYMKVPSPTSVITGIVRYSDNNQLVTSGKVKAFKYINSSGDIAFIDSAEISSDGKYVLGNIRTDSLYIGVYPNSAPIKDYVISYYSSTTYWTQAELIRPSGRMRDINIRVQRMINTNANNSVSGKVMNINKTLGNLKDAILYASNGGAYVGCSITDNNGVYHLASLPAGNLKIRVDRFGYSKDSTYVTVTSTSNTDSVIFYLNRLSSGIREINNTVPDNYFLKQNYPNPFNPSTTIEFSIPKSGNVSLMLYDITGREIGTLFNGFKPAGNYAVDIKVESFASGLYFYRISVNNFIATRKMLLIK